MFLRLTTLIPIFLFLTLPIKLHAQVNNVSVDFQSWNLTHILYEGYGQRTDGVTPEEQFVTLRLVADGPDGIEVLDQAPIPETGQATIEGVIAHHNLPPGATYQYRIESLRGNGDTQTHDSESVTLDSTAHGWLGIDETIAPHPTATLSLGFVVISPGISLTLEDGAYTGGDFNIQGTLQLGNVDFGEDSDAFFDFYSPANLAHAPPGTYYLRDGPNTIANGEYLRLHIYHDVTIEDSSVYTFEFHNTDPIEFNLRDCFVGEAMDWVGNDENPVNITSEGTEWEGLVYCYIKSGETFTTSEGQEPAIISGGNQQYHIEEDGSLECTDTFFRGGLTLDGDGDASFDNCEFAESMGIKEYPDVSITSSFLNSAIVFEGEQWLLAGAEKATIENNTFMGGGAVHVPDNPNSTSGSMVLGANFYGDSNGPRLGSSSSIFLLPRGAQVSDGSASYGNPPLLTVGQHLTAPTVERRDYFKFPNIWMTGLTICQNSSPHGGTSSYLMPGRETLLSVEVTASAEELGGVKIYAVFDGEQIEATNPYPTLYRDSAAFAAKDIRRGRSTVNFFLPPVPKGQETATLTVYAKTTGNTEFENNPEEIELHNQTLHFNVPYSSKLNVTIVPVKLLLPGYLTVPAPNGTEAKEAIEEAFRAMLPLSKDDVNFEVGGTHYFTGLLSNLYGTAGGIALANGVATYLRARLFLWNGSTYATGNDQVDIVIAILPSGALGPGIGGASLKLRRSILVIDENSPEAAIHELGHAFGLYIGTEQYDLIAPSGQEALGMTIFIPEPIRMDGVFGDSRRMLHIPPKNAPWYSPTNQWFDIMSSISQQVWPIPETAAALQEKLQIYLLHLKKEQQTREEKQIPVGEQLILLRGLISRVEPTNPAYKRYWFNPGTVEAMPLPEGSTHTQPAYSYYSDYAIEVYDEDDNVLLWEAFGLTPDQEVGQENDLWYATYAIPGNTAAYRIYNYWTNEDILVCDPQGPISNTITSPASGETLGSTLTLAWTDTVPRDSGSALAPARHSLLYSIDGGTTWTGMDNMLPENSYDLSTDPLPSRSDVLLKVLTTDGLQVAESVVGGLTQGPRTPLLTINTPQDRDRAFAGHLWTLDADAVDIDAQTTIEGTWTSNLDGILGTNNTLTGIDLSVGDHVITFSAEGTDGLAAQQQIEVFVDEQQQVDLAIEEDALYFEIPKEGYDLLSGNYTLQSDTEHVLALSLRNEGIATNATLRLYLTPPDSAEELLAEETLTLEPFEEATLRAQITPQTPGTYLLRAEAIANDPSDTNTTNNSRSWAFSLTDGIIGNLWLLD